MIQVWQYCNLKKNKFIEKNITNCLSKELKSKKENNGLEKCIYLAYLTLYSLSDQILYFPFNYKGI